MQNTSKVRRCVSVWVERTCLNAYVRSTRIAALHMRYVGMTSRIYVIPSLQRTASTERTFMSRRVNCLVVVAMVVADPPPSVAHVFSRKKKNQAERKKSLAVRRSWQGVTSVKQECRP